MPVVTTFFADINIYGLSTAKGPIQILIYVFLDRFDSTSNCARLQIRLHITHDYILTWVQVVKLTINHAAVICRS